jgi:dipeptidase
MYFRIDSANNPEVEYMWERPISTQQTGFSFVSQSRSWLPDPIGGVLWYGVDDTYFTCYFPLYCGINDIPSSYTIGSLQEFSWESAWWIFNLVSNYANLKYSHMIKDIQKVQSEIESNFIALQPTVEASALSLYEQDGELLTSYLTDYSVSGGETVMRKWQELAKYLICKYNDGYVKDENGRPQGVGYPDEWLKTVVDSRPDQFKLPPPEDSTVETRLID